MSSEETALSQLESQLQARGYNVTRMPRNSPQGDLHAEKNGRTV